MDDNKFFDAEPYFKTLCMGNKYAHQHNFYFCTCSGIESLEGPLDKFRKKSAFFCIDDTNDSETFRGRNGGYFKKRTFTIFLMRRYKFNDMADRSIQLAICRNLFLQICSRLLVDEDKLKNDMIYLNTNTIMSRELGQYFLSGCTGLYFMIDVNEPINLEYDSSQWI